MRVECAELAVYDARALNLLKRWQDLLTIASSWARQLCGARASQCEGVLAWEGA